MTYKDLLAGIERFGSTTRDICQTHLCCEPEMIHERVIIAPWWKPSVFQGLSTEITEISPTPEASVRVWDIKTDIYDLTYIKSGIGAPVTTDVMLALGCTPCKKAVFVGSVGALDANIGIGDIVIPEYSVCGDGVSRYLENGNIQNNDTFGQKSYPDAAMIAKLKETTSDICDKNNVRWHIGRNFSIDTIFAQFVHIDEILNLGCNVIEMETAALFKAASLCKIPVCALFSVSDNTLINKSLISGRTEAEMQYRRKVRANIFPRILLEALR